MTFNQAPATPLRVTPGQQTKAGHYRIRIVDLVLPAWIGIYDSEKAAPQRIRVNIELEIRSSGEPFDDDIGKVVSYETIVNGVKAILAEGHINLVETLAERIAELCLGDPRVARARVGVDKPDIVPEAASVGIEIERSR